MIVYATKKLAIANCHGDEEIHRVCAPFVIDENGQEVRNKNKCGWAVDSVQNWRIWKMQK